jgi:hypothetical protein
MPEAEDKPQPTRDVAPLTPGLPPTRPTERRLFVQELTRAAVALATIVLLFVVVILAFAKAATWDEARTLLDIFVPVISALVGGCVGFYFAERHHD